MDKLEVDVLEQFIKESLRKLVNTEKLTLEEAYQKGFEDAMKLIKNSIELI